MMKSVRLRLNLSQIAKKSSPNCSIFDSTSHKLPFTSDLSLDVLYSKEVDEIDCWLEENLFKPNHDTVGFDVEFRPNFVKGKPPNPLASIQLCVRSSEERYSALVAHVFHIPRRSNVSLLERVFSDSKIKKVGVSVDGDVALLRRFFLKFRRNCIFRSMVGLEQDSRNLSFVADLSMQGVDLSDCETRCEPTTPPVGLKTILGRWCGIELEKKRKIILGNWERPLNNSQITYAAMDSFAGLFADLEMQLRKAACPAVLDWRNVGERLALENRFKRERIQKEMQAKGSAERVAKS